MRAARIAAVCLFPLMTQLATADEPTPLRPGVRGLATRASGKVTIDGKLGEWSGAFCTPVAYNHGKLTERAGQFFYLWDDEALYVGLRALDTRTANVGNRTSLFNGDAVEFYFDARSGEAFRSKEWTTGAIHLHYTAFEKDKVAPRWAVRQGIATSDTKLEGVQMGTTAEGGQYELEFKLPWANFPGFAPKAGAVIGLDAELCNGDGGARTDRTFAYGSPLSVQQPASMAAVELVAAFAPEYLPAVGPSAFPMWVETPWTQPERARVRAVVAIPPDFVARVGGAEVRIHDLEGRVIANHKMAVEPFGPVGSGFARLVASWPIDDHAPNTFLTTARVLGKDGKALATVAPRLVQEGILSGR